MAHKEDTVGFSEYGLILRRSWPFILFFAMVGCAVSYLVTQFKTPVYESNVELVVERSGTDTLIAADVTPFKTWDDTFTHTQIRVLQSEMLLTRAVRGVLSALPEQKDADHAVDASAAVGGSNILSPSGVIPRILQKLSADSPSPSASDYIRGKSEQDLLNEVTPRLEVSSIPRTRILKIRVKSPSSEFAVCLAENIVGAYAVYVSEAFSSSAETVFRLLQLQSSEARKNVEETAKRVLEFKKAAEIKALTSGSEMLAASGGDQKALIGEQLAAANPEIAGLQDELMTVEQEIKALAARYKPKHPEMQTKSARRDFLVGQISELKTRVYLRWQQEHLTESSNVEFSMLEQDLEAARKLHEVLVGKLKEVDFSRDAPSASVRTLKKAEKAVIPSYPRKGLNLIFGGMSGLMAGLLVAFMRAFSRSNLVSLSTHEETLSARILGQIPLVADRRLLRELLTTSDLSTPASEAVRAIRTALVAKFHEGPNVVLVTSPDRGDGKSTVSVSLSQSFAQLGHRVLLVDVDLRRGKLHDVFGSGSGPGLGELLAGDSTIEPIEVNPNMVFLPRGHSASQPAEMLGSPAMEGLVSDFINEYGVVVLDSPPLLPVTDAAILARYANIIVMVARSQKTHVEACRMAAATLGNLGYSVDGIVLNAVTEDETSHGGYYHRYYYQGYDTGKKRGI